MTDEEFNDLAPGDVVRHIDDWRGYIVTGNYGSGGKMVVRTQVVYNAPEWILTSKAHREEPNEL